MAAEEMGWGTTLALVTGSALVAYTAYQIHNRREELRETIEPLGGTHVGFIDDLEAMVAGGRLVPEVIKESHG